MSEDWDWKLTDRSKRHSSRHSTNTLAHRIISKLEEVVTDQWREPTDYLEPLARSATSEASGWTVPPRMPCRS